VPRYRPGDVVLVMLPYTGGEGAKRRPAVVLLDVDDADVIVVPVTSQAIRTRFDVALQNWSQAGLRLPSIVRVDKPAALHRRLIDRALGALTDRDWADVRAGVRALWDSL
jgi:mRNA interferase MazF